ncbi:hypothetical protein SCUP234_06453 [Seiridium cupressi]
MSPNGSTRWGNPEMHTQLLLAVVEACLKDGKLVRTQANAAASVMAAKGFNVTGEAIRSKPISKSRFWSSTNMVSYRKRTEAINGFQVANVLSQRVASVRRVIHVPHPGLHFGSLEFRSNVRPTTDGSGRAEKAMYHQRAFLFFETTSTCRWILPY